MNKNFFCDERTTVAIDSGKIRGCFLNGVYYFRGIPYCETERFQMPHAVTPWEGVRDAVTYGRVSPTIRKPDCVGSQSLAMEPLFGYRYRPEGEVCQFINVWTKDISGKGPKKPVMVWVHGGGFSTGSSVEQLSYEGGNLCKDGDVIVVSFNHRLNILGYLDMSEYGEKYANSGNAGMADIVEALRWVQRNIEVFGGDPNNVTLFGQSGGGGKIMTLLQMPVANDLYHKCIIQSGLKPNDVNDEKKRTDGKIVADALVKELGLTKETVDDIAKFTFDELREAFLRIQPGLIAQGVFTDWAPKPDGEYYVGSFMEGEFTEKAKTTPCLVGCTAAEQCLWTPKFVEYNKTEEEKLAIVTKMYGEGTDEMIRIFKETYPEKDLLHLYHMDVLFRDAAIFFCDKRNPHDCTTYCYLLDYDFQYMGTMPSYHGAELPLVFNNTDTVDAYNEPDAQALGVKMSSAWAAFAHTGNPGVRMLPEWKPYTADGNYTMVFGRTCTLKNNFDRALVEAHQTYAPVHTIQQVHHLAR